MAVFTQKQVCELSGRMSTIVLDNMPLGPWQNVLPAECETGPPTRTVWHQVQGE